MNLYTELYLQSLAHHPASGRHILGHQDDETLTVYQAYNHAIADFALANGYLGGSAFRYSRMSWIKPNFLWMMYRCGWAEKENQERVLALRISKTVFEAILSEAVFSSFKAGVYLDEAAWRKEGETKEVRLQWDPDHDPHGNKLERRAIQLGLKGKILERFGKECILRVDDLTPFVKEGREHVRSGNLHLLEVPVERVYRPENRALAEHIGLSA